MSYVINTHHVPRDGWEPLLGRCGQAEWFSSLLTQLSRERIKGTSWASVDTVPYSVIVSTRQSHSLSVSYSEVFSWLRNFIICYSVLCTYAGMHCLVFYPHWEHSWECWWPLTSGSKRSNGHLLHKSDSTCIQKVKYREITLSKAHETKSELEFP